MCHPNERQQMMLAHAVETDVSNQHKFVVLFNENSFEMSPWIKMQAHEQLGIHPGDSGGCFQQPFAVGVFSDRCQNLANSSFDSRKIDRFCSFGIRALRVFARSTMNTIVVIFRRVVTQNLVQPFL